MWCVYNYDKFYAKYKEKKMKKIVYDLTAPERYLKEIKRLCENGKTN